jgi:hypothetical protein
MVVRSQKSSIHGNNLKVERVHAAKKSDNSKEGRVQARRAREKGRRSGLQIWSNDVKGFDEIGREDDSRCSDGCAPSESISMRPRVHRYNLNRDGPS